MSVGRDGPKQDPSAQYGERGAELREHQANERMLLVRVQTGIDLISVGRWSRGPTLPGGRWVWGRSAPRPRSGRFGRARSRVPEPRVGAIPATPTEDADQRVPAIGLDVPCRQRNVGVAFVLYVPL